jgi:WD40 repeat protein
MMIDVRQNIDTVPLSMLVHPDYRTEKVELAFYLTMNWDKECYFYDAVTGERVRIMDGTIIERPLPQNHEQRYYIEGPDTYRGSDGVTTSTTQPTLSTMGNKVWAYSPDRSTVIASSSDIIESARLYDLTGRLITTTQAELLSNSITLQNNGTAGVYIVDVTLRNGTTARTQVIVQ